MHFSGLKIKWNKLVNKMNKKGVPLPLIRDPKTGLGSVSLTLLFISFNLVIIGLVGKWVEKMGGFDIGQALNLFYACAALYFGRNISPSSSSSSQEEDQELEDSQSEDSDRS
jgi:hypothetical protein